MRIRMLDSEGTRVEGKAGHYRKGLEYELPDDIAKAWIEKRIAELAPAIKRTTKQVKGE